MSFSEVIEGDIVVYSVYAAAEKSPWKEDGR